MPSRKITMLTVNHVSTSTKERGHPCQRADYVTVGAWTYSGQLTTVVGRRVSEFIHSGISRFLYADLPTVLFSLALVRIGKAGHEYQPDLQLVRIRIAPIYRLKKSGCVLPVGHEHFSSIVIGVKLMKFILSIARPRVQSPT
jgi:hypothetical protein